MRPKRFAPGTLLASLAAALTVASAPSADEAKKTVVDVPDSAEVAEETADSLSGEEIYDRVLSNRFDSFDQSLQMTSGDRGGNIEVVKMEVKYKSFRKKDKKILSKSMALYKAPQDVRHMGYLIVNKKSGKDDQFVYRPSSRRVRRVNLRGESVVGTDFSLEDIIPRELEDAEYARLADETLEAREVYVVEVRPREASDSQYSKFLAYVDKESFVTLRTLYWDDNGVKFKELVCDADSITKYEGKDDSGDATVWVARESKVTNTQLESYTTLEITRLEANPKLGSRDFTERKLTSQGH